MPFIALHVTVQNKITKAESVEILMPASPLQSVLTFSARLVRMNPPFAGTAKSRAPRHV
jgi:hypothetical protein